MKTIEELAALAAEQAYGPSDDLPFEVKEARVEFARRLFALRDAEAVPVGYWFSDDPAVCAYPGSGYFPGSVPPNDAVNVVALYDHAPAPSDLQAENERLNSNLEDYEDFARGCEDIFGTTYDGLQSVFDKLRQQLAEARAELDAIPEMLQTVRTQAWADFRQQIAELQAELAALKQQEPVGTVGQLFDDCVLAKSGMAEDTLVFTAPVTNYKDVAERLLGALEKCKEHSYYGNSRRTFEESSEAIAAAKAAGLGEE